LIRRSTEGRRSEHSFAITILLEARRDMELLLLALILFLSFERSHVR
jgi:hypothetical protein